MRITRRRLDPSKWIDHFKEQAKGVRHPARDGYIFVNKGQGGGGNSTPAQIVSPVQQAVDQARAEIKRGIKRKSSFPNDQLKKKSRRGKKVSSRSKKKKPKNKKRKAKGKKTRSDIFRK